MALDFTGKSKTKIGRDFDKVNEKIDEIMAKPKNYGNISTPKTRAGGKKASIKKRKRPSSKPPAKKKASTQNNKASAPRKRTTTRS